MSQPSDDGRSESYPPQQASWADPAGTQPSAAQPYSARPSSGQSYAGQSYAGQPQPGQPQLGRPYVEQAHVGPSFEESSTGVQPYGGQPYGGQASSGPPYAGHAYSPVPQPGHPYPVPAATGALVSAGGRFGSFLLDVLLCLVTLGIGYLVWALITWADGQTPAKRLLGHVVVDANTGVPFDWGRMALRQFVIQGLLGGLLSTVTLGIYFWVDSLMIFGQGQRTLHDRMANSVVRFR